MKIQTDKKWKQFKYRDEVPKRVLAGQFDWTKSEDGFFKYQNTWYHLSEFERVPVSSDLAGWDGIKNESFSTGVLIKLSRDGEEYIAASYRT